MSAWSKLVTPMSRLPSIQASRCCGVHCHSARRQAPATTGDSPATLCIAVIVGPSRGRSGGRSVLGRLGQPAHQEELIVGPHAGEVGHAVAQAEKGGDGADVPDVLVVEAV